MCIAIVKPAGKWVTKEHLYNSFNANKDGAGYAYLDKATGKIVIKKGFFSFDAFFKQYSQDVTTDTEAMVHFRISTAGKKDEANCHPFAIDHGALMHNGPCLNRSVCPGDKERSDTRQFADELAKTWTAEDVTKFQRVLEHFIGTEKVAFMYPKGDGTAQFVICNEKNGQWYEGCWYSNSSFRGYYSTGGSAIRDYEDGWYGYGGGYTAPGASRTAKDGAAAPAYTDITRSFGKNGRLFRCKWSVGLRAYVPYEIVIDDEHLVWGERFQAYVPASCTRDLSFDKKYVYEATEEAMAKGPDFTRNKDWVVVGDCLHNEGELRVFLREAKPYTPPAAPAPAPAVATAAAAEPPVTPPALPPAAPNTAADASAAASSTVH